MESIYEQVPHESVELTLDNFEAGYSVAQLNDELGYAADAVLHM